MRHGKRRQGHKPRVCCCVRHYKEVPTDLLLLLPILESCSYFTDCELYQFEPPMAVTNFLLTRDPLKDTMPLAHVHCPRLQPTDELLLAEPYSQRGREQHTHNLLFLPARVISQLPRAPVSH